MPLFKILKNEGVSRMVQQEGSELTSSQFSSVQLLTCVRLFVTPWTAAYPGLPIRHQRPESTQTHVHWVGDAF